MPDKTEKPKRKRASKKPAAASPTLYFNSDTQAAIVEHQQSTDLAERERIFVERIHPAFDKLVENLINIHRFSGQYDSHSDLKSDCVTFLYESINKFKSERGTNAFSYFNIVAKHWLVIRSKKRVQRQKRNVSLSADDELTLFDQSMIEEHNVVSSPDDVLAAAENIDTIMTMLEEIKKRLKNKNEIICIDSIISIFKMSDKLDMLNKSAVLTYIREMSGLTPKQLTMTMHSIKKHYRDLRQDDDIDDLLF